MDPRADLDLPRLRHRTTFQPLLETCFQTTMVLLWPLSSSIDLFTGQMEASLKPIALLFLEVSSTL